MRKSGLHKQISSIFDGASVPNKGQALGVSQGTGQGSPGISGSIQASAATLKPEKPLPVTSPSENAPATSRTPALMAKRPEPLPKKKITPESSKPNVSKLVQQTVFGSEKQISPHQKKMMVLVGILSIAFGVVMYISLGGVGQTQANAETDEDSGSSASASASKLTPESWVIPEPVPANLRDATIPKPRSTAVGNDPGAIPVATSTELQVRGIVYSETKPSAIINDKIYTAGASIRGVKITAITRDEVTFEVGGKSWTQQVQR